MDHYKLTQNITKRTLHCTHSDTNSVAIQRAVILEEGMCL